MNDKDYDSIKSVCAELAKENARIGNRKSTWPFTFEDVEYEVTAWPDKNGRIRCVTKQV